MRLLQQHDTGAFSLTEDLIEDDIIHPYTILSHTWVDGQEVTFQDLKECTGGGKSGYDKLWFCAKQAKRNGLQYFWVDTCCIDKSNFAEVSREINAMFRRYREASRCYVYLSDVPYSFPNANPEQARRLSESAFRKSRWFTRGWTLQELLAPTVVEFFSSKHNQDRKYRRLGDKSLLRKWIHEITGIPFLALERSRMTQFSVEERFMWSERRETTKSEDKIYSLLGIFDVEIPLFYGEGPAQAYTRLREVIDKREKCMQDLCISNPCDDKKRIEETKGGLLEDSYRWILQHSDFQQWRHNRQNPLLWIKGDPGKGKTMLLCGIADELNKSVNESVLVSYFFCQATDSRINNATAVLRGLIYMLLDQQPSLVSHIRKKYDQVGKTLFEDVNAWVALSDIFANLLQDPSRKSTFLLIDALDECIIDVPKLLDFITKQASLFSRVKWIVSSRNEANIERRLQLDESGTMLSLELKDNAEQVARAVDAYIDRCVSELKEIQYDKILQEQVREKLRRKSNGTFLWVSLTIKELSDAMSWDVLQILEEVPTQLKDLYHRMIGQIKRLERQHPKICLQVLSVIVATYRPLHLRELYTLSELPTQVQDISQLTKIVKMCGSFLTIQDNTVYIIHQSARDFLSQEATHDIFPLEVADAHYHIFLRSLQVMSSTLRRNMYSLRAPGFAIERVEKPDPDPLLASHYSCIYWVDHLCGCNFDCPENQCVDLQDGARVDVFLREKFLYWLEALSLHRSMSKGLLMMSKLETLVQTRVGKTALFELARDAVRFISYHKQAIQNSPLQTYVSALIFSPASSPNRLNFRTEEPSWIMINTAIADQWGPCLQTFEENSSPVSSVAFSHDSALLASASGDDIIRIWDVSSGECLKRFECNNHPIMVAFSRDSTMLALVWDHKGTAGYGTEILEVSSGERVQVLERHSCVAFSRDVDRLASVSRENTCKICIYAISGECLQTLQGHSSRFTSVTFSDNGGWLASGSEDTTARIWDIISGECLQTFEGMTSITSIAFSRDGTQLAVARGSGIVQIWGTSGGKLLRTLYYDITEVNEVISITCSHDVVRLASVSTNGTIKIWDASSGECVQILRGHSSEVNSVTFSHNSTQLASASCDGTVRLWDISSNKVPEELEGHSGRVTSIAFSHDSTEFASSLEDHTVRIWDANSGGCLQTLRGHSDIVSLVVFSHDSTKLASVSDDDTV